MTTPRDRATAIVIRNDTILLVRDVERTSFALPGGGINPGEEPIIAMARELHEETTLKASSISYLFEHSGKYNTHYVFRVEADGDVSVTDDLRVEEFTWWDRQQAVSIFPHVLEILGRFDKNTQTEVEDK